MSYLDNFYKQISGTQGKNKLVFLHGLMGSLANWRKITPHFEKDFQILNFDQRGHGKSFKPEFGYSPEHYSEDLVKILDELGWVEPVYLIGHSMGGRNALSFASKMPHRVKKLVIEDIGPDALPEAGSKIHFYLNSVPTPFESKKVAKEFFDFKFPELIGGGKNSQTLSQYFYTNIEIKENGVADWRFSKKGILDSVKEGRAYERWDQLRSLKMPTLVIRGQNSDELSLDVYERMIQENQYVTGCEIENAGHWVHFDEPQEFVRVVKEFFAL